MNTILLASLAVVVTSSAWVVAAPAQPTTTATTTTTTTTSPRTPPPAKPTSAADTSLVQRGQYLATIGGCAACHTATNGKPFAGGLAMNTPFGTISTPNITPDAATGIGGMTDDQFYRVMHDGIGRKGEYLYPAMPFPWYATVSRDDVLAIKAYLFAQPAVRQPRVANHLAFPFNVRNALAVWRQVFFKPETFVPDPDKTAQVNRGAYLVNGLGHCGECHNGRLLAGTSARFQQPLRGGAIDNWYAPNITSDVKDGIGGWSDAKLVQYLKTGALPDKGVAVGPMAEAVHGLSQLNDDDLQAIAAYLKSTPAAPNTGRRELAGDPRGTRGAGAYLDNCASCHGLQGEGRKGAVPPLAGNGAVLAKGPQNVLQVVLGGLPARDGYGPMLAIGASMSDSDVADVANYVRQQWGNDAAPSASANMVYDLRRKIDTPMTAGPLQGCPAVTPAAVARGVADPARGIGKVLAATTESNLPGSVAQAVQQARAAAPGTSTADMVNGLTAAYCQVVRGDATLDWNQRALRLGHFSELVYLQLSGPDKRRILVQSPVK